MQAHASAPGKIILCGEHAVVYGRPAIALPLSGIRARASVTSGAPGIGVRFDAPDLERRWLLSTAPNDPLSELTLATLQQLGIVETPDIQITITSDIPIASGMGSGAAIATAIVRALAAAFGQNLSAAEVSALVYESEQRYHGTPSGIDNTVIAYEQAIWFQRRSEPPHLIEPLPIATPFTLLIGDTGVRSATRLPVGEVRRRWQEDPACYEALFDQVAEIVHQARCALAEGDIAALGPLLDRNQELLEQIGVSSPELERLIAAARRAGAAGAKLSGGGWGGVMIALVDAETLAPVRDALLAAGAARVLETSVSATA
ncbi:MAG: mevalonate kinase [Roseiflexus sp.]|nr:mevalonate kinase [Roseiflexus sp.]MCS7290835.1 mevalonate kinase [Roseiflexus sp.]MDW8146338.1 mevalonate kinase [Roseiflexaceae bacterium]